MIRELEPFEVLSVETLNGNIALISTNGIVFARPVHTFTRIPIVGENLFLETVGGCRVTGLTDGNFWLLHYSDEELAAQDAAITP